jgi:hypothetical protein
VSTFLDEKALRFVYSPSHKIHVKSWFGQTVCGTHWEGNWEWRLGDLTSLREVGRMARSPKMNNLCGRCAKTYMDVNVNE